MCLGGSAMGSGLPSLPVSLVPWRCSPAPLANTLLWSPNPPFSLPLFLPLRSAPFPWLPLPLADCYAICS